MRLIDNLSSFFLSIYFGSVERYVRRVVEKESIPGLNRQLHRWFVSRYAVQTLEYLGEIDESWRHRQFCFSQEGEDLILSRLFVGQEKGFFVDIGAFEPIRFSNTYLFYVKGWRGINVDSTPNSMDAFRRVRPEDSNIEAFVSDKRGPVEFYMFKEGALNTSSKDIVRKHSLSEPKYKNDRIVTLVGRRLDDILDEYMPSNTEIDFLNVDVEGAELNVLKSNNWETYRPRVLLIEQLGTVAEKMQQYETTIFLDELNYRLLYKTYNTSFFIDKTVESDLSMMVSV